MIIYGLGNYKLISERVKRRKIESNKDRYQTSPNKCNHCFTPLEYRQRHNKFCGSSCSAKFNNAIRDNKIYEKQKQTLLITLEKKGIKRIVPNKVKRLKNDFCKKNQTLTCVICNTDFVHVRVKKSCSRVCQSQLYRNIAIHNKLGGNKNTRAYGWYESPIAGKVWLESSYELIVAQILDQSNIQWQRPKYIPYVMDNVHRKYYPDFYLVEHDIYLDPKNDYLIEQDKTKIELVCEQNNVRVYVLNKNQLTLEHISSLFR